MHSLRNESDFDLIVVGAGPSGSMAALSAQRRGTNTLLLEREEEVGSNVICGEAVSSSIFKDFVPFDQRWVSSRITSASLGVEGRGEFTVHLAEAAWVLKRRVFDRDLSHMAERAGVTLVTGAAATGPIMEGTRLVGVKVEFGGEERHYFAPVVIGADGIASIVGRWAGPRARRIRLGLSKGRRPGKCRGRCISGHKPQESGRLLRGFCVKTIQECEGA